MEAEHWTTLSPLLDELLELEGAARTERLAQIARDDPALAARLADLMALEDERPDFLAHPLADPNAFAPQPGQEIGPYRLVVQLGEGGMGQVWLAIRADGLYERRVALKLLRPGLGDAGLRVRFTRERQILARLGHAHIARLLDAGISQDGQPYLALDYVQGVPITEYARRHALDLPSRLALFAQVCAAVSHAHANLVVHRDLKPSNILVTDAGDVCLLDFGIAKLLDAQAGDIDEITRTGARTFTLHYAAPEQLRGEPVTTMTDVYALGVVLYELLAEARPYALTRASDAAWEEAILHAEPLRPSLTAARAAREHGGPADRRRARQLGGDLDNILLKALAKTPEQRYASVEALALDLRRHSDGQPVQARPQSLLYRTGKYLRRHALSVSLVLGIGTLLTVALSIVYLQARRATEEASRAEAMQDFVVALFENSGDDGDKAIDVRSLLASGAQRADVELATQPQARAELLGLIAQLRAGLGDSQETLRLLARQQELFAILGDATPDHLRLQSAALRGRSLRELERPQDCIAALAGELPLARTADEEAGLAAAEFLSQLGRCHRQAGDVRGARELFTVALQRRALEPGRGALRAESAADLAMLLADEGRPMQAVSALLGARDELRRAGGERNALGVRIWQGLGEAYGLAGNGRESEASYRQALDIALARFGANHPRTGLVQGELAAVLLTRGKLGEAARLDQLALDQAIARFGPDDPRLYPLWRLRGDIAWELDRIDEAETGWREALRLASTRGVDALLDRCRVAQARVLRAADDTVVRACLLAWPGAPAPTRAAAAIALAESALDRGATLDARSWLPAAEAGVVNPTLSLQRARLALAEGRSPAAYLSELPRRPRRGLEAQPALRWQADALRAEWLCRRGASEGRAMRAQVLAEAAAQGAERARLRRRLDEMSRGCR